MKTLFIKILKMFFFPNVCFSCSSFFKENEKIFCESCFSRIEKIQSGCLSCGGINDTILETCSECLEIKKRYWDEGITIWHYSGVIRDLVHRYKYRKSFELINFFAEALTEEIKKKYNFEDFDVITWVPMHFLKYFFRGYNQTHLLAKEVGKRLGLPCIRLLKKVKYTKAQVRLGREQRHKNMKKAFAVRQKKLTFSDVKNVLILDDVFTTGATLNSASKILKDSGVCRITAISIARGK